MQPWRFIVVQSPEQKKKLRAASYNQAKVEEASAVIVACGDADGWRKDLDEMLEMGRAGGMPESYASQAKSSVPAYLSSFSADQMKGWLNKQVMLAYTHMLPMSYWVVALLAVGHLKGNDKFDGGRFSLGHTVFGEEFGKALVLK
jgi:nitroreductase